MAADPATGGIGWSPRRRIFAFNAPFYGSMGGQHLNQPIVGMAAVPGGTGYWLVSSDGGIFSFGTGAALWLDRQHFPWCSRSWAWQSPRGATGYWLSAADGGSSPSARCKLLRLRRRPAERGRDRRPAAHGDRRGYLDITAPGGSPTSATRRNSGTSPRSSPPTAVTSSPERRPRMNQLPVAQRVARSRRSTSSRRGTVKSTEAPETTGVDPVIGGVEKPQVPATVAVGPKHRLGIPPRGPGRASTPRAGRTSRPSAVLAFVTARQEPPPQLRGAWQGRRRRRAARRWCGRRPRRCRDDDDAVASAAVPFQASLHLWPQSPPQMALGEQSSSTVDIDLR